MQSLSAADSALCLEAFQLYEESAGKILTENLGTVRSVASQRHTLTSNPNRPA